MVRTRFAPSPTGFLHVGGARTALYAWLYARKMGGQFILRIEDTDLERSTPEAVNAILEAMDWLDLKPDEGPYYQTKRFARYLAVASQLLSEQKAYYCHCTPERLNALRDSQVAAKQKPRYDGHCRDLNLSDSADHVVVRFKNPLEGSVIVEDAVHGRVVFENTELDDLVIVRSNRAPTYNFTVVVDDWEMQISHVIRGDDHLNNTPRQMNILKALGATLPVYAHIPMILGSDAKRLSKRHGAVSVQHYQEAGILADALLNYLVRLGWSHGDQEIFSREQMIDSFDLDHLQKSAAIFNPDKLQWLNQHYIKQCASARGLKDFIAQLLRCGVSSEQLADPQHPRPEAIWQLQRERAKTLKEMAEKSLYFYQAPTAFEPAVCQVYMDAEWKDRLSTVRQALSTITDWGSEAIHQALEQVASRLNFKLGDLAKPLRLALTGGSVSPPIDGTLSVLGQIQTLSRLDYFIDSVVL